MTYNKYLDYVETAKHCDTAEDLLGAAGFGESERPADLSKIASVIYSVAKRDVGPIVGKMSGAAFAAEHKLPDRTVRSWLSGERQPPEYLIALIGYAVIGDIPETDDPEAKYE